MAQMEAEGKLKTHTFEERGTLLRLAEPVKEAYAAEVGASDVLAQVNSVK